ncbi:hypothetical protein DM44_4815 [Burkholderia cepacia]|jgi:hypothetical protein|uniref:hypothetical protein n=1 Tax=Burkholderia cenocepacia TaxID=95486 RepID=UPI0004F78F57|nr:hypothetical protein [Burkholderia cenocepacia]AIO45338.1 hypothetical protein DM42_4042 [Burkholderia cepacia]KGC02691.1 hypothetical protein DM44_4815 [Burkholderia cepacia]MDN7662705.1 hypothetical protein [Burkholderia cenocepacia]
MNNIDADELYGQLLALVAFNMALVATLTDEQCAQLEEIFPQSLKAGRQSHLADCSDVAKENFDQAGAAMLAMLRRG